MSQYSFGKSKNTLLRRRWLAREARRRDKLAQIVEQRMAEPNNETASAPDARAQLVAAGYTEIRWEETP